MKRANQQQLGAILRVLFPKYNIIENSRTILQQNTGNRYQLDYWIPELNLGFEFQGPHHYVTSCYSPLTKDFLETKDNEKKEIFSKSGGKLVVVPYWWGEDVDSLIGSIRQQKPELFPEKANCRPIPLDLDKYGYIKAWEIPDVGELMNVSFVTNREFEVQSWWMSEKYDGIRACWNPLRKKLYLRDGKEVSTSDCIVTLREHFPLLFVEGEIWFGRGNYKEAHALMRSTSPTSPTIESPHSSQVGFFRFLAFDSPPLSPATTLQPHQAEESRDAKLFVKNNHYQFSFTSSSDSFETRFNFLEQYVPYSHPFIINVVNVVCSNKKKIETVLNDIWDDSGEGLVLRLPLSLYINGNSDQLLKLKGFRDEEGLVTDITPDHVLLKLVDGSTAQVHHNSEVNDLQLGDVVTFSFCLSKNENLWNPQILRKREDIRWEDVQSRYVRSHITRTSTKNIAELPTHHKMGHWTANDGENLRTFFENYAATRNFDSTDPENWYSTSYQDIISVKGGSSVLQHFDGSVIKALFSVFPNIGFDQTKFKNLPQHFWKDANNRKMFLQNFTAVKGFDPLFPDNWYSITATDIKREKNGHSFLTYYGFSLFKALRDVYPNVTFEASKFATVQRNYWSSWWNRRKFFDDFAKQSGFDPLKIENWYSRPIVATLQAQKQGGAMFTRVYGSLRRAVADLYLNPVHTL